MSSFTPPAPLVPLTKARSVDINNLTSAVATAFAALPTDSDLNNGTVNYGVDSGTANTYIVTLPRTPTGYVDGLRVVFSPINSNTGASTINVNGLGVKNIRLQDNSAAEPGTLVAGIPKTLIYGAALGNFFVEANSVSAAAAEAAAAAASASAANASKVAAESAKNTAEFYRDEAQTYAADADFSAAQAQAAVVAAGTSTIATSTSSVTVGNGTKTFTVPAGKQFGVDQPLVAANGNNKMFGSVVSYSGTTLVINCTVAEGSGTFASWTIAPSGPPGAAGSLAGGNLTGALNERRAVSIELPFPGNHTLEIWAIAGNFVRTFGGGTIVGVTTPPQEGAARTVVTLDNCAITSSASMIVRGVPAGVTTPLAPGDELQFRADVGVVRVTINRASGRAVVTPVYTRAKMLLSSGTFNPEVTGMHRAILVGAGGTGALNLYNSGGTNIAVNASGGGAGGLSIVDFYAIAGSAYSFVAGAPGAAILGNSPAAGNSGGASTFSGPGISLTCNGGGGGNFNSQLNLAVAGAVGGTAFGGDYNYQGGGSGTCSATGVGSNGVVFQASGGGAVAWNGIGYSSGDVSASLRANGTAASGGASPGGRSGSIAYAGGTGGSILTAGAGAAGASLNVNSPGGTPTPGPGYPMLNIFPVNLIGEGGVVESVAPTTPGSASGGHSSNGVSLKISAPLAGIGGYATQSTLANGVTSTVRAGLGAGSGGVCATIQGGGGVAAGGLPFVIILY